MTTLVRVRGSSEMLAELERAFAKDELLEKMRLFLFPRLSLRAGEEMTPLEFIDFLGGAVGEFAWEATPLGHAEDLKAMILSQNMVKMIDALAEEGEARDHLKASWERYRRGVAEEVSVSRHHRMPI